MRVQNLDYEMFQGFLSQQKVVSIIGESGTGKTTLSLQLVANLMTNADSSSNEQTVWVQASEAFPKKRLLKMYQHDPEVASNLLKNIFIIPKQGPFFNFTCQSDFLQNFKNLVLPPGVKYIVIDNISHHLRLARANITDFRERKKLMNDFFDKQLFPLIMFSLRNNYILIFIHEVSYDPHSGQLKAYNNQLFERIKAVEIYLSKSIGTRLKSIRVSAVNFNQQFTYEINDQGLIVL
jgi:RecA/RadA recombinase